MLFLDEIQECERAITALRYFKEELPKLHVIAAGSLVDFVLEKTGIPVEVKSSAKGSLKSMAAFLASHKHSPYGLRISELPFSKINNLHSIPFYAIEAWLRN